MRRLLTHRRHPAADPAAPRPSQLHRRLAWLLPVVASVCLLRAWLAITTFEPVALSATASATPAVDLAAALAAIEPGAGPAASLPDGLDPKALLVVADELKRRRDEVERREKLMAEREAAVRQVEPRLAAQIAQLEGLKTELESLLEKVNEEDERRLTRLVKLYEAMKPKKAAPIFEQSDPRQLLPVLRRMREAKVAAIIEEMDPVKAKALTTELGHNRLLPGVQGPNAGPSALGSMPVDTAGSP